LDNRLPCCAISCFYVGVQPLIAAGRVRQAMDQLQRQRLRSTGKWRTMRLRIPDIS
jgi:hypothetical protein